jgi:hypothetical protein
MFGTIARIALMRVLPRRLLPVLAAWQVISALRGRKPQPNQDTAAARRSARRVRSR